MTETRVKARRRGLVLAGLLATTALGGVGSVPARAQAPVAAVASFDIPALPMADALIRFGQQAGVEVSADAASTAGRRGAPVHGAMGWRQALDTLLAGSGLTYGMSDTMVTVQALPGAQGAIQLSPVSVQGQQPGGVQAPYGPGVGYMATRSAGATKTDTPLIETPQAVSVVTRQQMTDQNVQSVAQALRYTSGAVAEQRGANTDSLEYVYSRGFQVEEYLNGLRLPGAAYAGYNITSIDAYLLDRIELVHGPAAVLYGQSSPGGILVLDSKRPTEDPIHEIMLQTGSYGRAQGAVDLSGKLTDDGSLLGRITANSFTTGTQTDHVNEKRIAIAPSITWKPDADTTVTLFADYQWDPDAGLYNSVPAPGTVLGGKAVPRSLDPGEPSFDRFSKREEAIGYSLSHRINDTWTVFQDFRYLHNDQRIQYVGVTGVAANGTQLTRASYYNQGTVDSATLENRAQAKFSSGPLSHTAIFGVDWQDTQFDHVFLGGSAPNLSITNPVYGVAIAAPTSMYGTSTKVHLDQEGFYAQDQVRLGRWAYMIGVREDIADESSKPITTGAATQWDNSAFTWRTGLVYLFDNGLAPYASYSTSFQPSTSTGFGGALFKPTTGQQYEVGIKYQPPGRNSFVTLSAYNLTQQNVSVSDPVHTGYSTQTGEIRSRGIEAEAHANLTDDLRLIATYTYTDARNTKSTTAPDKQPVGIPTQMASGWVSYDVPFAPLQGLQLGGGARYLGASYGDAANTFKVPDVTLFDLAVHYDFGKALPQYPSLRGLSASVTASNIFDRDYISYCSGSTFCTYGLGRLVLANLKYDW